MRAFSTSYLLLLLFLPVAGISSAADNRSLADIVRANTEVSKASINESNKKIVPGYNEQEKDKIATNLNNIPKNTLEHKGAKTRNQEIRKNADGIYSTADEASKPSRLKGYENYHKLEMFNEMDNYMRDPVAIMAKLTKDECRKVDNNPSGGYKKSQKTHKYSEKVQELQICQAPTNSFNCKKSLKVKCTKTEECDDGGIVTGSLNSNLPFTYSNGIIKAGNTDYNNLSGHCNIIDQYTTFKVKSLAQIKDFTMISAGFDDYMMIKINGHVVYVGPDGGNTLEVRHGQVFNGYGYFPCERYRYWWLPQSIDMRTYLKEGDNAVETRVIVTGWGRGGFQIRAKAHCCAEKDLAEEWVDNCEESRE